MSAQTTVESTDAGVPQGLRDWLQEARRICVLTGAGMSAESGIATFRDAQSGLWSKFDPMQLASEAGFRADPGLVWDWYASRREGVRQAEPNAGHVALARFEARHPERLAVVTQNVDDLHRRAGQATVVSLHGRILDDRWLDPCPKTGCATGDAEPGRPPRCAQCGNLVRPDVVWFGEALDTQHLDRARALVSGCEVLIVVGTSGVVWPAAGLAELGRQAGALVVIVNPVATEIDHTAHVLLRGTAAGWLPRLLDEL